MAKFASTLTNRQNIPTMLQRLPRWLPMVASTDVEKSKQPATSWGDSNLWKKLDDISSPFAGFVIQPPPDSFDSNFLVFDFDNVLDDDGNFISQTAHDVANLLIGKTYGEYSKSGHGLHFFVAPAKHHFISMHGSKDSVFYLDDKTDSPCSERAKLEIYYDFKHQFVMTGNLVAEQFNIITDTINPFKRNGFQSSYAFDLINSVLNTVGDSSVFHLDWLSMKKSVKKISTPVPVDVSTLNTSDDPSLKVASFANGSDNRLVLTYQNYSYHYDKERALKMLSFVSPALFEDADWLKIQQVLKNHGLFEDADAWNRLDEKRYDEQQNLQRWNSLSRWDLDIKVLYNLVKNVLSDSQLADFKKICDPSLVEKKTFLRRLRSVPRKVLL